MRMKSKWIWIDIYIYVCFFWHRRTPRITHVYWKSSISQWFETAKYYVSSWLLTQEAVPLAFHQQGGQRFNRCRLDGTYHRPIEDGEDGDEVFHKVSHKAHKWIILNLNTWSKWFLKSMTFPGKVKGFIIQLFPRYFWLGQNSLSWDLLGGINENVCQDWTEYALFALSWRVPKRCRSEEFCWRFLAISQNDAFSLNQHLVCVCGFIWLCWFDMAHVVSSTF